MVTGKFIGFLIEEIWDRRPIEFNMRGQIVPLGKRFIFEVTSNLEARLRVIKDETKTGQDAEETPISRHSPTIMNDADIQSTLFLLTALYIDSVRLKRLAAELDELQIGETHS